MSLSATILEKIRPGVRALPADMPLRNPHALLATWFGSGLLRPAPGTIGSLAAIPPGFAIAHFWGIPGLSLAIVLLMIAGTIASNTFGKKTGEVDNQSIVVDEVVGLWIAALPAATAPGLWFSAFVLFRIFDICKPWPASFFDNRSKNGFDVMMDDVVAGFYAGIGVASAALMMSF